jgi:hypothetical protein
MSYIERCNDSSFNFCDLGNIWYQSLDIPIHLYLVPWSRTHEDFLCPYWTLITWCLDTGTSELRIIV